MTPHSPHGLSRRGFLTAAATGLVAAAASMSCTSRGCTTRHAKMTAPASTSGYVDRAGWMLTADDNRKLGPLTPAETR